MFCSSCHNILGSRHLLIQTPGMRVYKSPYAPDLLIDVRGLETGTVVVDPLCKKGFVVPEMIYLFPVYAPPERDGKAIIGRGLRK